MYKQIEQNKRKTVLLMTVFVVIILLLGYFFGVLIGDVYIGLTFAIIFSLIMNLTAFFKGDKIALKVSGAQEITKQDNPYVYRMVENLCITAGLPMPKIYIIPDQAMNAFATGRDPEHSSIALTQGIIDKLENEELEGVIAHELSHIKNYDIRVMTIVIVLVGIVIILADWLIRGSFFSDRDRNNSILIIIGIVFALLSPLFAQLIQFAISRKREFLADADGALLTRYPEGLARALEKIAKENKPMKRANKATAHLYFSSPFGIKNKKKSLSYLFSTHPPIEERIKALRNMLI